MNTPRQIAYYIIGIIILLCCAASFAQCPKQGDSKNVKLQNLDTLKNRNYTGIPTDLPLDSIFMPGDDTKRFSVNRYAHIQGYVFDVKYGGSETCNCHSKDKKDLDVHIEIVRDLANVTRSNKMIVEINRYAAVDFATVHMLKGRKVDIYGWMFADDEHKQNAVNTNPYGTNLWRQTIWECHPVMSIKEAK